MKIGIIGYGYVGSAVAASYPDDKILINDPKYAVRSRAIDYLKKHCRAIFVCVPTPQTEHGNCDTSILEEVIEDLKDYTGVVISKSTASPIVYQTLEDQYQIKLAHVPEFLTQARAKFDYVNPHKIVVGCKESIQSEVTEILMSSAINFNRVNIEYCSIQEASFFKYLANTMLAIKVVMNNEFYQLANKLNINWDSVTNIAKTDYRLGATHWQVPGTDGSYGFGGACFPKDTEALSHLAKQQKVPMTVLETAIKTNYNLKK